MKCTTSQPCMKGESSVANPMVALTFPPLPKPKQSLSPCYNICGHAKHTPTLKNILPLHLFFYVHWLAFYHMIPSIIISHIHFLSFNKWLVHGSTHHPSYMVHWWVLFRYGPILICRLKHNLPSNQPIEVQFQ